MTKSAPLSLVTIAVAVSAVCAGAWRVEAATYIQTDLVSDISGLATVTDPELMNSWGISHSGTSPFWISNQATNVATLYTVTGSTNVSKVNINPPSGFVSLVTNAPQGPTGQVANSNMSSFLVGNGGNNAFAHFIFAGLNGTISAWDTGTTAFVQPQATISGASYTGLAINQNQTRLYAANNAATTGSGINVFDSTFTPISLQLGPNAFIDPSLPAGLVPFNVQDINAKVYVTYAPAGHTNQTNASLGQGVVNVFDENGVFQQRLITNSNLAAPWGVALAPSSFGQFGGDLLVGNFSTLHSFIGAYNPTTGAFLGTIPIDLPPGIEPGGLWALEFGNGVSGGSPDTLYFSDGINAEADGLFGAIETPLPAALPLFATGIGGLGLLGWRRKRKARATS
jgi:uncharacterized protein (TIGR03118 family)